MEMVWRILGSCKKIASFRQELISPQIAPSAQQKGNIYKFTISKLGQEKQKQETYWIAQQKTNDKQQQSNKRHIKEKYLYFSLFSWFYSCIKGRRYQNKIIARI